MHRLAILAAGFAALFACGCNGDLGRKATAPAAAPGAATTAAAPSGDQIREQLAAQNYGHAAELAAAATAASPNDPQLHLLRAEAEGCLGNAGAAVASLERAVLTGLPDRKAAFADPAFDRIRHDAAFRDAERRLLPQLARAHRPRSTVRAGDVDITEYGGSEHVRAGDVELNTRD